MRIVSGSKRGFTLIELLVVIAIIGLAAALVLASMSGARKKSRDARRLSDMKQLHNALELYVSDNKTSPSTAQGLAVLAPTYIATIPPEPSGGAGAYGYVQVGASGYVIGAILETVGQVGPLNADYDGAQNSMSINGIAAGAGSAANCNANAGLATEAVYCEYWP